MTGGRRYKSPDFISGFCKIFLKFFVKSSAPENPEVLSCVAEKLVTT
jgi:hypothetical protein